MLKKSNSRILSSSSPPICTRNSHTSVYYLLVVACIYLIIPSKSKVMIGVKRKIGLEDLFSYLLEEDFEVNVCEWVSEWVNHEQQEKMIVL